MKKKLINLFLWKQTYDGINGAGSPPAGRPPGTGGAPPPPGLFGIAGAGRPVAGGGGGPRPACGCEKIIINKQLFSPYQFYNF